MPLSLTIRERALLGLIASLEGITEIAGLAVYRNRRSVQTFPALSVLDGTQSPLPAETGMQRYVATPQILGFVQTTDGSDPAPDLNALYGLVIAKLRADVTLGDIAIDLSEGDMETFIDPEDDSARQGQFNLEINIEFETAENDPFSLP